MDLSTYVAKYIKQTMAYPTHHVVTKDEFNDILNLLITQGDYNTDALEAAMPVIRTAVSSSNILSLVYNAAAQKMQLTIDGVAWVDVGQMEVTLVPHTHGNISADGKLPVANKLVVTDVNGGITTGEGASTATPNTLMQRDAAGRAQVADPAASGDIANKNYVDNADPIGTIKYGYENPWGTKGFLCNGATIDKNTYPTLFNFLSALPSGPWTLNAQGTATIGPPAYGNGYFVAVQSGGSGYYYKTDTPDGAWTHVTEAFGSTVNGMRYANGYWVAITEGGKVYYAADITTGVWAELQLTANPLKKLIYANGYWTFTSKVDKKVYYQASVPTGDWLSSTPSSTYGPESVAYGDGYWIVGLSSGYWCYTSNAAPTVWSSPVAISTSDWNNVTYANGWWVLCSSGSQTIYVKCGNPPSFSSSNSFTLPNAFYNICYYKGYWIGLASSGLIYYAALVPNVSWMAGQTLAYASFMGVDNDKYIMCAGGSGNIWYASPVIPIVQTYGGYNAYIKAL
jgi:hypothetical protein